MTVDLLIYTMHIIEMYDIFNWNSEENKKLIKEEEFLFGISLVKIENKEVLDLLDSVNYPNQKIFVLEIDNYVYLAPFVENEGEIFLKTIIPSRKFTKIFKTKAMNMEKDIKLAKERNRHFKISGKRRVCFCCV